MAYDEQLGHRIRFILESIPGFVEKKMFGGVGFLINGNMACGVNGDHLIVRMSEIDYQDALMQPNVHEFDLTGRPMKGWVTVDPSGIRSEEDLRRWVERGLNYAQGLPPK